MITVISYPDRQIDYTFNEGTSTNSEEIIKLINIKVSDATTDEYIIVNINGTEIELLIEDECRYTPADIFFLNKEGSQQMITFFKARTDTLSVSKETYESDSGQPIDSFHQYSDFNIQGRSGFKLNSGFVDETMNESFKQLILSRKVYLKEGDNFIPVNITKSSLEYKTRQNDRLINYEFDFKYSYNEINNI